MPDDVLIFLATKVASTEVLVILVMFISFDIWRRKERHTAWYIIACLLGVMVSVNILKEFFMVPRPEDALVLLDTYAFPSGHAAGVVFFAGVLFYYLRGILNKNIYLVLTGLVVLIFLVGLSRVYLGVHTSFQVFAGYGLGALWIALLFMFLKRRDLK